MQTISAISTAASSAGGIGIVRLSGEDALKIAKSIFTSSALTEEFSPSKMYLGTIFGGAFKEKCYMVYFKAPKSFTGEDTVELHCHGGIGILNAVFKLTVEKGARPARAGEFTKRAFVNGKLTLDGAEGVGEMISAETESAMLEAYRLMDGELARGIYAIEEILKVALATVEGSLDYPDEMSYENSEIELIIKEAYSKLEKLSESSKRGRLIKNGINIAIVGLPNSGKSSLLNCLLQEERAIVTNVPGTTRDTLSESVNYMGYKLTFIDTAGIRESGDIVERLGVERSKKTLEGADIVLLLLDASEAPSAEEAELLELTSNKKRLVILNKTDIKKFDKKSDLSISCLEKKGIEKINESILEKFDLSKMREGASLMLERHVFAVNEGARFVKSALDNLYSAPPECTAQDLKQAMRALSEITGSAVTEDTVDEIFSRFCVGK